MKIVVISLFITDDCIVPIHNLVSTNENLSNQ